MHCSRSWFLNPRAGDGTGIVFSCMILLDLLRPLFSLLYIILQLLIHLQCPFQVEPAKDASPLLPMSLSCLLLR
jgi:hypothetical protein